MIEAKPWHRNSARSAGASARPRGLVVARLVLASLLAVAPLGAATVGKGIDGSDIFLDVVVKDRFFRPSESAPVILVRSREAVRVDCVIYDRANRPVGCYSGPEAITNQFKITLGQLPAVDRGIYSFCLVARNQEGHQIASYPKIRGGGEIIQVKESAVDAEHKQVTYMLPKAACVRLRAGFRDGLYLSPIVSSLAQPAGRHTVSWDGSCQNGLFTNLYQNPQIHVNILAVSLPVNVLVAEDGSASGSSATGPVALPGQLAGLAQPPWVNNETRPRADFLIEDDYNLALEIDENTAQRIAEVRVDCGATERPRLFSRRFELMVFLDAAFLMEDERSQMPFSYRMSTRGLIPGKHIVTANVIDTDGVVGTASREFTLSKP